MLNKWAPIPIVAPVAPRRAEVAKPAVKPVKAAAGNIYLLRRKELGNNCHFIADNYPGGKLKIVTAAELPANATHVIRWGTTTRIPKEAITINKASAIEGTSNKGGFRLACQKAGLTPRTWAALADLQREEFEEKDVPEAVIVRTRHHERSENIILCKTLDEINAAMKKVAGKDYYISEYIKKDEEYRVFVASGRAFMVFKKVPGNKNDVSWGCVEEGALDYVRWSQWPLKVVENAIKAFNVSTLDFGAADIIVKNGKPYFLEINTAPEVWPYYGECFGSVLSYMIEKGRERIPVKNYTNWKDVIHPAMMV